ncbi:menaquinone-dependent protoporphyrinogen oxidase [Lutibacter oricola]|uniref:Protoporphyrinogen IX dehydrogenase [quinone] n=1 Tax=Lutibacter oricola TaxID=762486 RepID=A0A1H2QUK0_9FLAO|nr:menaquinone-dependent protoporphyrinogen IX dehydrogenase [Lutibacter oricola]SDW10867.1 menaquinone-dependent protoporphyrinogen oxidase [Lutibacter oricola]
MANRVGILYGSIDGHTLKICTKIQEYFLSKNQAIEIFNIENFNEDVLSFDKLVIGSSIRYGLHHLKIIEFINNNKTELDAIKTSFFSVNLVARKPEKNTPTTNPYVIKFFKKIDWKPTYVEVFAGMLDYKKYKYFDRLMIQFIMWITKGPTNKNAKIEYTNWQRVEQYAETVLKL